MEGRFNGRSLHKWNFNQKMHFGVVWVFLEQLNSSHAKLPLIWCVRNARKRQKGEKGDWVGVLSLHNPLGSCHHGKDGKSHLE